MLNVKELTKKYEDRNKGAKFDYEVLMSKETIISELQ